MDVNCTVEDRVLMRLSELRLPRMRSTGLSRNQKAAERKKDQRTRKRLSKRDATFLRSMVSIPGINTQLPLSIVIPPANASIHSITDSPMQPHRGRMRAVERPTAIRERSRELSRRARPQIPESNSRSRRTSTSATSAPYGDHRWFDSDVDVQRYLSILRSNMQNDN